jgi:hypothetical protein
MVGVMAKTIADTRGFIKSARRAGGKGRKRKLATNGEAPGSEIPAAQSDIPMDVDDIEVDESKMHDDMRILIKVCMSLASNVIPDLTWG